MKNKTGEYLKYAIGEIVLVVIGILIALSINSWNQDRLNTIEAKISIEAIYKDKSFMMRTSLSNWNSTLIKVKSIISLIETGNYH